MWVKLSRPVTIHAATSVSVGPLKAQKLIAEGRAVQTVFPGSGDPDNVGIHRSIAGQRSEPEEEFAGMLARKIEARLGRKSASAWFEAK